jgi:hypothetical protein
MRPYVNNHAIEAEMYLSRRSEMDSIHKRQLSGAENAGTVELHIPGRAGGGGRLIDDRPHAGDTFQGVAAGVGKCEVAGGARAARGSRGTMGLELRAGHRRDAEQPRKNQKQKDDAARAPEFHG